MDSVVVSVRIKKEIKDKLEKDGIDVEKSVKEFLSERASQIELRQEISRLKKLIQKNVKPSKKGFSAKFIREDRNAHN